MFMAKRLIGAATIAFVLAASACDNRSVTYPTATAIPPKGMKGGGGGGGPKGTSISPNGKNGPSRS
jgi:hypothetical protein